jgi:hypothetical protein
MVVEVLRATEVPEELFTAESQLDAVALMVEDDVVGGTGRDHVLAPADEARSVGTGEGVRASRTEVNMRRPPHRAVREAVAQGRNGGVQRCRRTHGRYGRRYCNPATASRSS